MEKDVVKDLCKKHGKSEKFIVLLLKICEDNNVRDTTQLINEVCQKVCQKQR